MPARLLILVALVMSVATIGCEKAPRQDRATATVEGRVSLDGRPLTFGTITFIPDLAEAAGGRPGIARIEPDGSYRLGNANPEKPAFLRPGRYRVTILAMIPGAADGPMARMAVLQRYADFRTTSLTAQIAIGANRCDFRVSASSPAE